LEIIQRDLTVRVIILKGNGPVFCSGLDLNEIADPNKEEESGWLISRALMLLNQSPVVTMAAVHGAAIAGGAGIMAACDYVIAASDLQCGFPEVRRGLVPALISAVLHRQIPWRSLQEMLLFGEVFDAEKGKSLYLINRIVPPGELEAETDKQAHKVLKGAPEAIRETKRLLEHLFPYDLEHDLKIAAPFHHRSRISKEALEGAKAFFEKRDPSWVK
jgi:methylglutaconyl-CoA hydratase